MSDGQLQNSDTAQITEDCKHDTDHDQTNKSIIKYLFKTRYNKLVIISKLTEGDNLPSEEN
jgi:hypothetical protein